MNPIRGPGRVATAAARQIGNAFQLAHILSGGAPHFLDTVRPAVPGGTLKLVFGGPDKSYLGETARRQFHGLAESLGLAPAF